MDPRLFALMLKLAVSSPEDGITPETILQRPEFRQQVAITAPFDSKDLVQLPSLAVGNTKKTAEPLFANVPTDLGDSLREPAAKDHPLILTPDHTLNLGIQFEFNPHFLDDPMDGYVKKTVAHLQAFDDKYRNDFVTVDNYGMALTLRGEWRFNNFPNIAGFGDDLAIVLENSFFSTFGQWMTNKSYDEPVFGPIEFGPTDSQWKRRVNLDYRLKVGADWRKMFSVGKETKIGPSVEAMVGYCLLWTDTELEIYNQSNDLYEKFGVDIVNTAMKTHRHKFTRAEGFGHGISFDALAKLNVEHKDWTFWIGGGWQSNNIPNYNVNIRQFGGGSPGQEMQELTDPMYDITDPDTGEKLADHTPYNRQGPVVLFGLGYTFGSFGGMPITNDRGEEKNLLVPTRLLK
jgi:hypothetical protein